MTFVWIYLIFSISLPALAFRQCGRQGDSLRVVGGEPTSLNQYPWMLRMLIIWVDDGQREYSMTCGASIIDEQFALSAAHCVSPPANAPPGVQLQSIRMVGGNRIVTQQELYGTEDFLFGVENAKHPDNIPSTLQNDISIIKFHRRLDFNGRDRHLMPICLSRRALETVDTDRCIVTGWGQTSNENPKQSNVMKEVNLPIRPDSVCYQANIDIGYDPRSKLCAGGRPGEDGCHGDSGGPLQCPMANGAWILTGIVSYGGACAVGQPSFYVRVENFIDWVEQQKMRM